MTAYIALLRAVNVGGTGKLPMAELKSICEACGFKNTKTYIASGNVVFQSSKSETQVKKVLEAALATYAGKPVGVLVRTAAEMAAVAVANPFPEANPSGTVAIFLDAAPPANAATAAVNRTTELIELGLREIYATYPDGMGDSKLRIPAAKVGTARNINTIKKLAEMAAAL